MQRFTVTADVSGMVEIEIEADSREEAKQLFSDNIIMTTTLVDRSPDTFAVHEDGITDIKNLKVRETTT